MDPKSRTMPAKLTESLSAPSLRSLPRLHSSSEQPSSERVVKAEEYMYLQVKRSHWPELSADCRLWTLRDFALQNSNWESFTDKGKLRVIYELGALLCESGHRLKEDMMLKARNELQRAVTDARQLPRVVRSDKLRALAVASLCEDNLNLPGAARRIKEALGERKREEYDSGHIQNLSKKFRFRGYIEKVQDRSMTLSQLRKVLKYCHESCHHWRDIVDEDQPSPRSNGLTMEVLNLHHVDSWLIWPATEAYRSSFVELMADQAQPAVWCVSHCWSQPHASFVDCIGQHAQTRGLRRCTTFWIWAYAHRHHCVDLEPPESAVCAALDTAESKLLLVLQDVTGEGTVEHAAKQRLWCMFEVLQCLNTAAQHGWSRTPMDVAVMAESKAELLTYGLIDDEEAMEGRLPGSGLAAKAAREKGFPLSVVETYLRHQFQEAQTSAEEDRNHLLKKMAKVVGPGMEMEKINTRLNGLFALTFLRKVFEEKDEGREDLACLKELVASALAKDVDNVEVDVSLGGGALTSVDEELLLLVKNLSPRLQRITLDLKGSCIKNSCLAEVANFLSPEVQDILLDLQGCRTVTDTGVKRFMDNLVTNCDRSKLSTVSCLLMGTKVAEVCQEACEMLDLDQVHKVRGDLALQERKNHLKRLMKNVHLGKAPIASLRKLVESHVEVTVRGMLGEQGEIDVSHLEWDIHSKEMTIQLDQALLKFLLDVGAAMQLRKRPEAQPYCVLWPVPDRDPEQRNYKVHHRHQAFSDVFAEKLPEVQKMGKKATAAALLEMRGGDLVEAAIPSPAALQKLAFIYAAREGSTEAVAALLLAAGQHLLTQVDDGPWEEEDLITCNVKEDDAPRGTALLGAAQNGHGEVVQKLLDWGAEVNQLQLDTEVTALTLAAQRGWLEVASILLENGADMEVRDVTGRTPLSWAAEKGQLHIVEELLERQAHIDLPDRKGMTPLMHASVVGQVLVAQKLVEFNANIRAVDKEGKTAAAHATIYDSDKMGLQQKKQKILDMFQIREKELEMRERELEMREKEAEEMASMASMGLAEDDSPLAASQ
ncbi:Ankyrin repeat domain-containing protein 50 [Symbiodinium microadriaticum]|uniref:Ankyrin repeat domain-containing protein 50 n=1 Tax=Symbiodinium microadriaticum TaxID=2951 RepID=A0A1Q9CR17_SYMMI|nr:Ankyrin repeat domain-containing protein 50 [Symbiodinium microadriaticum]CAE7856417.1 ANKRD50 [Symbiodinium microadriaticum]CAE7948506.1 ANKRD50 [Symbiodinium sp. KB8]